MLCCAAAGVLNFERALVEESATRNLPVVGMLRDHHDFQVLDIQSTHEMRIRETVGFIFLFPNRCELRPTTRASDLSVDTYYNGD